MKIYEIIFESGDFQYTSQKKPRVLMTSIILEGVSRLDVWPNELNFEIKMPNRPRGIFFQWSSGEFILTPEAQNDKTLVSLLEVNGEFLPVIVEGQRLLLHNITCFSDCMNEPRSRRGPTIDGVQDIIRYPCFHADKVPLGIHFRVREYPRSRYTATDPSLPPEKDFYQWYHKQGYKGLKFRLQWDSEKPDDLICFY